MTERKANRQVVTSSKMNGLGRQKSKENVIDVKRRPGTTYFSQQLDSGIT
jgi:hypothetical protein